MVKKLFDFCTLQGCDRPHAALGYCDTHYRTFRKHGDPLHRVLLDPSVPCSVPDCGRSRQALGLCGKHYHKLKKYGDPLFRRNADHGEPLAFLRALVGHEGNDCVPWPYSRYPNGYGSVWHDAGLTGAHRLMCRLAHGEPLSDRLEAAHRCGNTACVNPRHIRWAAPAENAADKIVHQNMRGPDAVLRQLALEGAA